MTGYISEMRKLVGHRTIMQCATLLMYGLGRIHGKKEALEKERELHE